MKRCLAIFLFCMSVNGAFVLISSCVSTPDGADPTGQVFQPCPEHFGGKSVVRCFKDDCNTCVVKGDNKWVECELAACGK